MDENARIGGVTTCPKCGVTRPAEFIQCTCDIKRRISEECKKYDGFIPKKLLDHLKKLKEPNHGK